MNRKERILAILLSFVTVPVHAVPVLFEFTTTIEFVVGEHMSDLVSKDDLVKIDIIGDNGGDSLYSQVWEHEDLRFITITTGGYSGTWMDSYDRWAGTQDAKAAFITNEVGHLTKQFEFDEVKTAGFFGIPRDLAGGDNFGEGGFLGSDGVVSSNRERLLFNFPWVGMLSGFSLPRFAIPVPAPNTFELLVIGLIGMLLWKRN